LPPDRPGEYHARDPAGEIRRLDSLVYKDIPEPEPKAGHVVIEIKAFGFKPSGIRGMSA
jgi:NADPH:quinone reductase-like Zn-dependent oxidoreductase